jgi:hypothetical protein
MSIRVVMWGVGVLCAVLFALFALMVYQIRLHRKHTMMYELMFEARAAEAEEQARELEAVEARIKALEAEPRGPRLVKPNGKTA